MSNTQEPGQRRGAQSKQQPSRNGLPGKIVMIVLAVLLVSAVGFVITKGVVRRHAEQQRELPSGLNSADPNKRDADPVPTAFDLVVAELKGDFKELEKSIDGEIGLVVGPVGRPDAEIILGTWSSGPAWSTMKVPLTIAALRDEAQPIVSDNMIAAVELSDNVAADALWRGLGDPATAARKVEAVLRDSGDFTIVEDERIRVDKPELSAFGQTIWPLLEQARFVASAACDKRNDQVFDLMAHVAGDQSWGLGQLEGSRYKGGWGPSVSGNYLVRQIGVLQTPSGQAAVALAVEPASGSFAAGTEALNKMADWIADHEAKIPSGSCAP